MFWHLQQLILLNTNEMQQELSSSAASKSDKY